MRENWPGAAGRSRRPPALATARPEAECFSLGSTVFYRLVSLPLSERPRIRESTLLGVPVRITNVGPLVVPFEHLSLSRRARGYDLNRIQPAARRRIISPSGIGEADKIGGLLYRAVRLAFIKAIARICLVPCGLPEARRIIGFA